MQRSLEYYFNKPSSSAGVVPSESSEGTNTTKPVVLRIEPRKRPVGRPRKPSAKPATRQLVDYSSTDTEESTNESPPRREEEKYHERSIYKAPFYLILRLVITPYIYIIYIYIRPNQRRYDSIT